MRAVYLAYLTAVGSALGFVAAPRPRHVSLYPRVDPQLSRRPRRRAPARAARVQRRACDPAARRPDGDSCGAKAFRLKPGSRGGRPRPTLKVGLCMTSGGPRLDLRRVQRSSQGSSASSQNSSTSASVTWSGDASFLTRPLVLDRPRAARLADAGHDLGAVTGGVERELDVVVTAAVGRAAAGRRRA